MAPTSACKYISKPTINSFDESRDADLKEMIARMEFFTIDYDLTNEIPEETPASANCYDWAIT